VFAPVGSGVGFSFVVAENEKTELCAARPSDAPRKR
jgi:hypothetical protein